MSVCGAQLRGKPGQFCTRKGMANGRCRIHGGTSTGRPIVHGRNAYMTKRTLRERVAQYEKADTEPLRRAESMAYAVMDMLHDQLADRDKLSPEDTQQFLDALQRISKISQARAAIRNQSALTVAEVQLIQANTVQVLREFVPVELQAKAITKLKQLTTPKALPARGEGVVEGEVVPQNE